MADFEIPPEHECESCSVAMNANVKSEKIAYAISNISLLLFILYRSLSEVFSHIGGSVFFLPKLRLSRCSTVDWLIGRGRLPGVIVGPSGGG